MLQGLQVIGKLLSDLFSQRLGQVGDLLPALLRAGCQRLELGGQLRQVFHSFAEQLAALVRVAAQLTCQFFEH
ncbi:hypothetical protein D3C76_1547990 [compost metagenome]